MASPPRRHPVAALGARFPVLIRLTIRFLVALPQSRLRTRLCGWGMGIGFTASDRRDWEFLRGYMRPDAKVDLSRGRGWGLDLDLEYRGPEGYVTWFEAFTDVWSGFDTGELRVIAPAGNRVLVVSHPRGRGIGSGVEVTGELWTLFTYEGGWLARIENFGDPDEALAEVGLRRRPKGDLT